MRTMNKIAIINLKGGVGKSVTACNLACILGWKYSRRVLVMDLDKQANTSMFFRCFDPEQKNVADVLTMDTTIRDVLHHAPGYPYKFDNIDVVPCSMRMFFASNRVQAETTKPAHNRIKRALEDVADDYDYCIMDCPPDINVATANAFACADWVIVPVNCEEWAMVGLNEILDQVKDARKNFETDINVMCVLPTMYRRTKYGAQTINELAYSKLPLFHDENGRILRIDASVKVQEAISEHMPLYAYSPKSKASEQYIELARHVVKKVEG